MDRNPSEGYPLVGSAAGLAKVMQLGLQSLCTFVNYSVNCLVMANEDHVS